jgi:sec-independent protein translocase protein TatC
VTDEAATMSLLEHLEELRRRIIIAGIAVALAGIVGFFLSDPIIQALRAQLPEGSEELITLSVGEVLGVRLKIALFAGIALAMPVVLYQVWRFVTPGLTRTERRLVWPFLGFGILLFALGLGLGYVIIPFALGFLLSLTVPGVEPMLRLTEYIGFVTTMMFAFGLIFEFPIVLLLLARVGILNYRFLSARRRWAVLFIVLFAVVATPGGDPLSPVVLSLVMYTLFEITLQLIRGVRR